MFRYRANPALAQTEKLRALTGKEAGPRDGRRQRRGLREAKGRCDGAYPPGSWRAAPRAQDQKRYDFVAETLRGESNPVS
jgi:hypothetical protein